MAVLSPSSTAWLPESHGWPRFRAGGWGLAAALLLCAAAWAGGPQLEYAVKANYLCKFAPFVEWPASALPAGSPFNICVVGEDPFGPALDEAVRGQAIAGHPVAVRRMATVSGAPNCQVLYIGRSRVQKPAEVLQQVRGAPILTVSDGPLDGEVVQFVLKDGRVRFAIDAAAAQANGLVISSKLLGLATEVRR